LDIGEREWSLARPRRSLEADLERLLGDLDLRWGDLRATPGERERELDLEPAMSSSFPKLASMKIEEARKLRLAEKNGEKNSAESSATSSGESKSETSNFRRENASEDDAN